MTAPVFLPWNECPPEEPEQDQDPPAASEPQPTDAPAFQDYGRDI